MSPLKALAAVSLCVMLFLGLAGCPGGGSGSSGGGHKKVVKYTIGGTVSGLSGSGLVLQDNGGDDLSITSDGTFAFANKVANGKDYAVTVLTQPSSPNQTCTVNSGTGTVSGADVTDITITCSTNAYTIGGTVSGLAGTGLVLQNNSGDDLPVSSNGSFVFNTPVADAAGYVVTVLTQPSTPSQTCTVNSGTGAVSGADVTNVTVTCSTNAYTIGGAASGITNSVELQNNGGDNLIINTSGPFTFDTPVADTADYEVTILSSPGMSCALTNSSGTVSGADVTNVALTCSPISVAVEALYPANGADWNDYVKDDGVDDLTATDTACDASTDTSCLHGGEMRVLDVPNVFSCIGVTAADTLGVFDWSCDESTSPVRMVSTGLKDGKNLSDLIDFGSPGWKTNSVVVDAGLDSFSTYPAVWWSNPVVVDNDGGYLNSASTIYVVTDDALTPATDGYIINASSVGLVGQQGLIINGPGIYSTVIGANGSVTDKDFLWIEGNLYAEGDSYAVTFINIRFSVLRDVTADKGGISFDSSSHNKLSGVAVSNSYFGVYLYISSNNTFSGLTVSNIDYGVYLSSSSNNAFSGLTVSNNSFGVYLYISSNNTFSGVTAINNDFGIQILNSSDNVLSDVSVAGNTYGLNIGSSPNNTVTGITAASNTYALTISYSSNTTFSGATFANNNNGAIVFSSPNTTFSGVTSADNYYGISLSSSSNNYFTGPLKVDNTLLNCLVDGGTNAGLVNTTCNVDGTDGSSDYGIGNISDATFTPSVTLASSFVGKVYSDATNSSDTGSAVTYPADPASFDWTNFENTYRGWGLDGAFGNFASQGRWTSGNDGAIWDWSLASGYTVIRDVLLPPTGDDTLTHLWSATNSGDCGNIAGAIWGGNVCSLPGYTGETACTDAGGDWLSDKCYSVFLRNAMEIGGDSIGNDNTLCESDETCLYTPNIASYQGHGNLVDAGSIGTGGTLENITLMQYETNGR